MIAFLQLIVSGTMLGSDELVRVLGIVSREHRQLQKMEQKGVRLSFIATSICTRYVARTVGLLRGTTAATLGISTATTVT